MGYLFTPQQQEKDKDFISSTLEELKTTNLLKQAQESVNNANLNAQNTNIPQNTISQHTANNAQIPQDKQTQQNIGNINIGSNVSSTQSQNMLPQESITKPQTNTTPTQAYTTTQNNTHANAFDKEIALSSNKDFKPQSQTTQQAQIPQTPFKSKKSTLQREREATKYDTHFNQSAYTRNTTAFLGEPHEFKNYKLAMAAKSNLLHNIDDDANVDDEVFKRFRLIDRAVAALETAKKTYGKDSKEYKNVLEQYMQYGILKDNDITDYESLARFYERGGNVGFKIKFKESKPQKTETKEEAKNEEADTTNKQRDIKEFVTALKDFSTKKQEREQKDKGYLEQVSDWFNNTYKFDNKNNLEEQIKNGFSPIEGFNILEAGGLEKVLGEYKKNLEGITTIDGRPLNAHSHFASYINGQRDIAKGALDTLTFGLTSLLPEGQYQHVEEFFKYMDMAISVSEGASKAFNEFRDIYADMLNEDSPSKQAQLKEKAYKKLKEAKEKYESSPAKVYADSNLDRIAETIKHEHDYGRIFNFLRDKNIQKEVKQAFLSDFATILKKDEKYKDLDSLAFTKDNTLIAIMNEKEGQKAYAINPTLMSSILYSLYAAKGEVIGGIAGAAYGAMQGASKVKIGGAAGKATGALTGGILGSMIGTSIGALTDSAINKIVTGYANSDLGVKKALEAASLDLIGNAAIMGMAKGVAKAQDVFSKFDIQQAAKNIGNKSALFLHGNVNSVTNFLAKNALDSNEREAIMQTAQKQFLNGRSLAEYKSDTSIPKLERLKAAWQYEKYINKESMAKGKEKLEALSKDFESFQTTSMESNRPIMDILQDMFEGKATRIEREKFLRFVAQNEALHSALSSVISKNPTLAQNFGKFIDKRANNVAKSIESEALTQRMFKDMDSDYAKGLKERYGRVEFDIVRSLDHLDFSDTAKNIQDTLINLKQSIPHVTNAGQTISAMLEKLQARSNTQGDIALKIDDLLDIRKYYNDILRSKDFKNASYKHLQAINKEIDSAIESSLKDLENKSGINTTKLLNNYKDINKEYADYARFKESEFYKDVVKTKKKEKDLSNENFNKAILKQAQRSEGFNNKVFNKIANNTDKNLQAQVIKELIQKNITNGNGQLKAIKWQELIEDLEKIEHSITDSGLKSLIANFKQAQKLYHADNEFLQAVQRSIGSKPANVLISSASGLFGRTLLLFYNFVHKSMSRFAGALSENLAHQSLEHQLALALRYARDTKDFIHVSIDSISKNMPKEDKETGRILRELSYWKDQFEKDHIASFYTIKEAQQTQYAINAHQAQLIEYKAVINHAMQKTEQDMQGLHKGVVDSIKGVAQQQIIPLQQFGENYAEFQGKGALAIEHLLQVKQGQVAGAFHKDGLGDIDLVWGEVQGSGKDAKGFGLVKILEKHIDEFKDFIGDTKETKLINGLNEIIEKGKVLSKNGVNTIILSKNNKEYRVGLSKGFNGKGENKWVITAYEYNPQIKRGSAETSYHDTFTDKAPLSNSKEDTTTQKQTNQDMEREIPQNLQEAWLKEFNLKSITEDFIPQFNDEIRQALDKAGIRQDFHLKLGSLVKLDNKQREAFLPYIKPTIEHPNLILDNGKGILFIKEFVDSDKNRYFMSVAKDFNNEWIFSSHTRRELNNINNELQKSKVIYNNGFKGGEVAGASDILESGGTTTKPSDLQITYPANHSSGKNPNPNATTIKQTKQDMEREIPYNTQVEFDRQGMAEFQRRIENGEIQLEKATQRHLDNIYKQYEMLQERARELEESLKSLKVLDEESILKTNSTIISQTQRALNAVQDNISFTKEAIKDIENELGANSNKALMPYNVIQHAGPKIQGLGNNLLTQATTKTNIVSTQSKPSFIANLIKPQNNTTQVLIPYNTNKEANNALISYNRAQDPKLLARNEAKLLEYKQTLNTLQKLEKSFKDFMSLPFSIIVDSKGNALPLTSQAIKNFIFHNLYKEYMSVIKALDKPTLALDFKPLSHEIKALPYKANANLKAHLNDINAKTNDFLDSVQEFKKSTQEIKLLPYHKHTENKALDQFGNVMGKPFQTDSILVENMKKNTWHEDERYNVFNPKYHSYKMIDNKEVIKIPDFILSESGKTRKRLVEQESKQIELIEQINAGQTDKFDEFMVNEKKVLEFFAEEFGFKDSGIAQRCLGMADMLQNNNLKEKYLEEVMKTSYQTRHYKESTNKDILKAYQKVYDINRANHANTELQDISFTDKRGNEKILSKETQEQWLKTFGLENLEQSYIPKHSQEIQQALGGKEIKLTKGSLLKLVSKERERYIPQVKETLDNPDYILKDIDEMIILAKKIDDKQYFTSINLETDDFLISISNAPKKENILKNKVEKGAKIIYQSPNSESIFYTPELLQASQSLANKIDSSNSSIKNTNELTQQAKEQGLSQVQSNTNAQQLTLHDIQERLTARKKELEQQSNDLSTELKTQEKEANRVAPILNELLQKWRALNPLIIEWKERKEIRGKFGQFLGYEKKLSKRKPNLSNLEHIENTLEAYKSYAKNNEDSAESVKKEIVLLEDYVEKLKNRPNMQNLREQGQLKEQILSDERRKINTYHDLRQNFNKGYYTDLQILEANNIPQEQHKQLLEFISQTRSYIETSFSINPLKEFGTNYAEFYKDGKRAIQKLLTEAKDYETRKEAGRLSKEELEQGVYKGQVAGAFHKDNLGDIDLVWGEVQGSGKDATGFGLAKILEKHIDDFKEFAGDTKEAKLINGINEIIEKGKVVKDSNGRTTIIYNDYFKIGLKQNWKGETTPNKWIITAYEDTQQKERDKIIHSDSFTKGETLPLNSKEDSSIKNTNPIQNTSTLQNPSIPTPKELQIQVDKAIAEIDKLMESNRQIVDRQWLYEVHKPQEVVTIQKHYFNQEMPQEYKEIIAPFPKLREQEIADNLKQNTQAQLKQTYKEQFLETFKDKPFEKTRTQASNLLKTYYKHNPKGLGVEIKDWSFESANFKMALAKFQTKLKKGDEEVFETLWEAKLAKNIQDKKQEIENLFSINPIKEFGTNYAEFYKDGKGAIQKLLIESNDYETRKEAGRLSKEELEQGVYKGQVAGAFYKDNLGDIDLVWGEVTDKANHKGYGLAHIIDKRKAEFIEKGFSNTEAEHKTLELIKKIPSVIDNGEIVDLKNGKIRIITEDYTIGMKNEWHDNPTNPYILTTFENNKKSDKNLHSTAFTKGETLPLNSKEDYNTKAINESIKRYKEKIKALDDPKLQKEMAEKKQKIIDEFNETLHNASPIERHDKWGTSFNILYIKPEGKKRFQKLKFDTEERIQEAIHHYANNERLKKEHNVLLNVYNKLKEVDIENLREKQRLEKILKTYENDLKNIGVSDLPTTKEIIKQAKEQGLSQVQSNTNAQQLTLHDIQERLTARKKELEQQSNDLSTELKTQEKEANRVAPILNELLQKWRALNPLIIEWKERKEIRGKFGQFLGYEKKLSKRKPNLSNLEHIENTLEAYKSYAKNNEDSAESVKKEIVLLEDYVEKLKNRPNMQNLREQGQLKEQILSDERRKINTYHDLRQNFNKGYYTDLQILEANNIPQEQHKQLLEFISQTRSYIETSFSINPLKEFGTNYAEFYRDGKGAIEKLLIESKDFLERKEAGSLTENEAKQGVYKGQVAGAFYKEGLGDIDLVWGEVTDKANHKGYGLAHIIDKHPDLDPRLIAEIIEKGEVKETFSGANIYYNDYILGINKGWNDNGVKRGDNKWVVTAFDKRENQRFNNPADFKKEKDFTPKLTEDSSTKTTKYTIRELKTPSDEELEQIKEAYKQDNELFKQQEEITRSYRNKIEKTKSKKIKQRLEDEWRKKIKPITEKINNEFEPFLHQRGYELNDIHIKDMLERSERVSKPYFDMLEPFSKEELTNHERYYRNIGGNYENKLSIGNKTFFPSQELDINKLHNALLTRLHMSEYPKQIQYTYIDSPLFDHARWSEIGTKPDSELIYLGGWRFDKIAMNRQRKDLEYLFDIRPLKEFGTNYAEFYKDGKRAIQKLLTEAKDYETRKEAGRLAKEELEQGYKGQVAGAFYKEGLGDIDLVWGEVTDPKNHKGYGLAHILDKHPDLDIRLIPEIIEKGNLTNQNNIRYRIEKDNYVIGLSAEYKGDKRNFIITAFQKNKDKRDTFTEHPFTSTSDNAVKNLDKKENAESLYTSSAITKGETLPLNSKEDSSTKDQSKQHKGQEELKNIFDEFEQQDKTLQDKAKLLREHKEDLKSKDLVGSEKWESLMEQQSLLIDEESQILERAYKKAKRLMPHFSSYEEILQYEPINKVSLRLLKENVNEIMDKEIRALQDTSITKADFKQALDEFNTFYKEYRDYHKPLYYEFETKFGFYTREFNKQKLSNAKDVEMFKKYFLDKKPSAFNDKLKQVYETIQQYNQLELQNRQRIHDSKESELITSKAIEIKEQLNNKYKSSIQKQEISKQSENPHAQNFDQVTNSKELESGNNLSLMDSAPNPTTKDLIKEAKEQDLSVKETKEATQDSTQATQDLTHLKQKLENASDEEKGEIIKEAITEQNNKLLEEITKLQNVLEKKTFYLLR